MGELPGSFGRREAKRGFEHERQLVMEFLKEWQPYDWTQQLSDGGK